MMALDMTANPDLGIRYPPDVNGRQAPWAAWQAIRFAWDEEIPK